MKYLPGWSSHYPLLVKALSMTESFIDNDVLEMGMGLFSTPFLHWMCFDQGRKLYSYDNDPKYIEMNRRFAADWHIVDLAEDWDKVPIEKPWAVAFIDHRPAGRRYKDMKRLAPYAAIVVVHDTEPPGRVYAYHRAFVKYKYRYDWTKAKPHTTLLSNFFDVGKMI